MDNASLPVICVEGERIALGLLRRDLIPVYQRWNNDAATNRTTAQLQPTTIEQETAAFENVTTDETYALFTVYERETWRAIGVTYLADIDRHRRSAEFGIVIGEEDCRGKGYGSEATRLTLDCAFVALGLHSVMLWVYEYNHAGRRCYAKAGFREGGRRRQSRWHNGQYWDEIAMDILASELESPASGTLRGPAIPRRCFDVNQRNNNDAVQRCLLIGPIAPCQSQAHFARVRTEMMSILSLPERLLDETGDRGVGSHRAAF